MFPNLIAMDSFAMRCILAKCVESSGNGKQPFMAMIGRQCRPIWRKPRLLDRHGVDYRLRQCPTLQLRVDDFGDLCKRKITSKPILCFPIFMFQRDHQVGNHQNTPRTIAPTKATAA
jgi:hypothetical protein